MISVKLTNHDRSRITSVVLDYTFEKQKQELDVIEKELANKAYYYFFPFESSSHHSSDIRMHQLPDGWLPEYDYIRVSAGGYINYLYFEEFKRFPSSWDCISTHIIMDQKLISEIQTFLHKQELFEEETAKFKRKFYSLLTKITTSSKLYSEMPELEAILGSDFFGKTVSNNSLVPTVKEVFCEIAKHRNEERDGCCEGKVIEENE